MTLTVEKSGILFDQSSIGPTTTTIINQEHSGTASHPSIAVSSDVQDSTFRSTEYVPICYVKLVVLGDKGVGKTSIIERFVNSQFSHRYAPTVTKKEFFPSLVLDTHVFELKIIDLPSIPHFPMNTNEEWALYRYYGLRSATAYILVYDLSSQDSFTYIKKIRDEILESRNMTNVTIMVVANKADLIAGYCAETTWPLRSRQDVVSLVSKQWRVIHLECSARYNWNVANIFKQLALTLQSSLNRSGSATPEPKKKCC